MTVKIFNSNGMRQNVYLYYNENTGEGVIIDAGCSDKDIAAISAAIKDSNITVKAVLLTHGHYDHIIAVDEIKILTGAMVYGYETEKVLLEEPELNLSVKLGKAITITPDRLFKDGEVFELGDAALMVIHTPGHTQGGACYYDEKNGNLFAGDVLFMGSIGRSDLPGGDSDVLIDSIKAKLLSLPEDTKVYPGHGMATTIGREKDSNPFVRG